MAVLGAGEAFMLGAADEAAYAISNSLRFNSGDGAHLTKTFASAGARTTWTWSSWVKRTSLGTHVLFQGGNSDFNDDSIRFDGNDRLSLTVHNGTNGVAAQLISTRVFRDFSAWYHIHVVYDSSENTVGDRIRFYVNGSRIEDFDTASYPGTNVVSHDINDGVIHYIGSFRGSQHYLNAYLAETQFVDGLALEPTAFGAYSTTTGAWDPIEPEITNLNNGTTWSSTLTATGAHSSGNPASFGFNGIPSYVDPNTFLAAGGADCIWDASSYGFTNVKVEVYVFGVGGSLRQWQVNSGSAINEASSAGWQDLGTYSTLSEVRCNGVGGGYGGAFSAIRLNGCLLIDGVNNKYGKNGFRLDYDPTAGVTYSGGVSSTSTANSSYPASNGFDGSVGSSGTANWYTQGSNQTITVDLSSYNVTASSSVGFNVRLGGPGNSATVSVTATIGGTAYTQTFQNSSTQDQLLTFSGSGAVTTIVATLTQANGSYGWGFTGVQVDGSYLVDHSAPGADASGPGNHWAANNIDGYTQQSPMATTAHRYWRAVLYNAYGSHWPRMSKLYMYEADGTRHTHKSYTTDNCSDQGSIPSNGGVYDTDYGSGNSYSFRNVGIYSTYSGGNRIGRAEIFYSDDNSNWTYSFESIVETNSQCGERTGTVTPELVNGDIVIDSPTNRKASSGNNGGNYCTWNPLDKGTSTVLSEGNLKFRGGVGSAHRGVRSTIMPTSKMYAEMTVQAASTGFGLANASANLDTHTLQTGKWAFYSGEIRSNGTALASVTAASVDDIIQIAYDPENNKAWIGLNNTWYSSSGATTGNPSTGANATFTIDDDVFVMGHSWNDSNLTVNFGQFPFKYTPPTDFKSLCTQNLDDPLIAKGSDHFDVKTYDGDGGRQTISGLSFSPSLVWVKRRDQAIDHILFDAVRGFGANKELVSNDTYREGATGLGNPNTDVWGYVDSVTSDGFVVEKGSHSTGAAANTTGGTYVGWVWDGGDLVTNSAYNQSQNWTSLLTSSAGTISNPGNSFDGSTSTTSQLPSTSAGSYIQLGATLTGVTKLEVYQRSASDVSGTGIQTYNNCPAVQWVQLTLTSSTISNIRFEKNTNDPGIYAIRVNDKILVDPGVITVGSLNSSAYNDGEVWSTTGTLSVDLNGSTVSNMTGPLSKAFEGSTASSSMVYEGTAYTNGTKTYTYTFGTAQTNITSARVYLYQGNSAEGGATGFGNGTINKTQDGTYGWVDASSTIPSNGTVTAMTMTTTATSGVNSSRNGFIAIELNGKMLLDNNVTPVDNFPSIASTCRASQTSGCSIVTYSGNNTSGSTVGHNLNKKPDFIFLKSRTSSQNWLVYHSSYGASYHSDLNLTGGFNSGGSKWTSTEPTSSVFSIATDAAINATNADYVAYCFTAVPGFSAFGGPYTGTGDTSGPFQYCGFRPRWIMIKSSVNGSTSNGNGWTIFDTARSTYNETAAHIAADSNATEYTGVQGQIDILSNGFKPRQGNTQTNHQQNQYIWIAFAESPLKYARAR